MAAANSILGKKVLLLDGGLGTTLEDEHRIHFSSDRTPLWSGHLLMASPETLQKAQTDFARAGADVILTATYQASLPGFAITPRLDGSGVGYTREEAETYMRSAVGIARSAFNAAGQEGLVALSLGAFGATMIPSTEYSGAYPSDMSDWTGLRDFHLERLLTFTRDETTWADIDLLTFETLPVVREVRAVREAMGEVQKQKDPPKFWVSCVFPNADLRLPDGTTVDELVGALLQGDLPAPYAIGINCTKISLLRPLLDQFENAIKKASVSVPHLVLYPDGAMNLVYDTKVQKWLPQQSGVESDSVSVTWAEAMQILVHEIEQRAFWPGIVVGGCCKTSPGDIAQLRQRLDQDDA